jgi:GTPase SAR1 family protein
LRIVYLVGTAGSGKSSLTAAYTDWLKSNEQIVATVNLDPAAAILPYEPDIDIREYIDFEKTMLSHQLGPNAALIRSFREAVREIENLIDDVAELRADYVLVDTPGQLELFAFRREGRELVKVFKRFPSVLVYLLDPVTSHSTRLFAASLFLTTSVYFSLDLQTIIAVTKIDAVPRRVLRRIKRWINSQEALEVDIESKGGGVQMLITRDLVQTMHEIGRMFPVIMLSAKKMLGLGALHAEITKMVGEGEYELR